MRFTQLSREIAGVMFGVWDWDAVVSIASQHSDKQAISKQGRLSVYRGYRGTGGAGGRQPGHCSSCSNEDKPETELLITIKDF